jgi:hypothetical protein
MQVRRAIDADIPGIDNCLSQVLEVHAQGRPDLFRSGTRKYTDDELRQIIADDNRPVFVAVNEDAKPGEILGYGFCVVEDHTHSNNLPAHSHPLHRRHLRGRGPRAATAWPRQSTSTSLPLRARAASTT